MILVEFGGGLFCKEFISKLIVLCCICLCCNCTGVISLVDVFNLIIVFPVKKKNV